MLFLKLFCYFLIWSLWSYGMHVFAHANKSRFNFVRYFHLKHHAYNYEPSLLPPWHDYFFWFGDWRSSIDVYLTFTLPLLILAWFDTPAGLVLLAFHYLYEVFLSRNVLDHNSRITGWVTHILPVGAFHLEHHRNPRCNYSFYTTAWDYLFQTDYRSVDRRSRVRHPKAKLAPSAHPRSAKLEEA